MEYIQMYKSLGRLSRAYIRQLKFPMDLRLQRNLRQNRIEAEYEEMIRMGHDCELMICNHGVTNE